MSTRVGMDIPASGTQYRARKGPPPGVGANRGRKRRDPKKKKNRRTLALAVAIAFLFLFTPAQDKIKYQLGEWKDDLMEELSGYREYPVAVSYSVEKHVTLDNVENREVWFNYRLPIPIERTERGIWGDGFEMDSGADYSAHNIQHIESMDIRVQTNPPSNSETVVPIPLETSVYRTVDNAIDMGTTQIFWPQVGDGMDRCSVGKCVIWEGDIAAQTTVTLIARFEVSASSFSWWEDSGITSRVDRSPSGFSASIDNSGNFEDITRSGYLSTMHGQFGIHKKWYDRDTGSGENYAINGQDSSITSLASEIRASLDADEQDNVYAFSESAFNHIYNEIVYDTGLQGNARSGPKCIADGRGDCDEQSNAWMSLLRVYGISAWYEFGPMTDAGFGDWEPHAWANVLIPLDEDWCESEGIDVYSSCFVEASVDVVNNKWLLHTPTSFTQWIEQPSTLGEGAYKFYRPLISNGSPGMWGEEWTTVGDVEITGGSYEISAWVE